jgi:hypothetical protein
MGGAAREIEVYGKHQLAWRRSGGGSSCSRVLRRAVRETRHHQRKHGIQSNSRRPTGIILMSPAGRGPLISHQNIHNGAHEYYARKINGLRVQYWQSAHINDNETIDTTKNVLLFHLFDKICFGEHTARWGGKSVPAIGALVPILQTYSLCPRAFRSASLRVSH